MIYSHYWARPLELNRADFAKAAEDVRLILEHAPEIGIPIAGPLGVGKPVTNDNTIAFNGLAHCGHRYRDLGEPEVSITAHGVRDIEPPYDAKRNAGSYSGPLLETRVCNGNCAGDPFVVDRIYMVRDWEQPESPGQYANKCGTHFKPYDLIVACALIRIKEHLGDAFTISSENPAHGFEEAIRICREIFGWHTRFEVKDPEPSIVL